MDRITLGPISPPTRPDLAALYLVASVIEHQIECHPDFMCTSPRPSCWILAPAGDVIGIELFLLLVCPEDARECVRCASLRDDIQELLSPGLHLGDEIS